MAGFLFKSKNPKFAPETTNDIAATINWLPNIAKTPRVNKIIAALPATPPSTLSKKFIELEIATIQSTVSNTSTVIDPDGFPKVLE